jgi:hypothetical protein
MPRCSPDLVRTDRHNHRQVAGDSPLAEAVKVLARAHQGPVWARQRHASALRSALREYYPGALAALGAQPGLGVVLAARVLGEFGDDPTATPPPRAARRSRAPPRSPALRATQGGGRPGGVQRRLVDACYLWAFAALSASPGARRCYDAHRARGQSHHQALRALGNRLVGILHGCLAGRQAYQEQVAWPTTELAAANY